MDFLRQDKDLSLLGPDRQHHASALRQLLFKRSGDLGDRGGHEDPVVGGVLHPAQRSIAAGHVDVEVAQPF
mgnify:CR=1 FL=1